MGADAAGRADGPGRYGSDLIADLLNQYEIPYVALNPGSTYRGLHDSIVNYAGNRPEIITCPHEKIAVGIAHGYARVTGQPMAAILHNVVGLLHGALGIYQAYLDRAPVLVIGATGPMEGGRRRPRIDWDHTALVQGNAVRDFVKWDDQPFGAAAVVDGFARAYRIAVTEPQGPVYICYDVAFQEEELTAAVALPDAGRPREHARLQGDPAALDQAAEWLCRAERPVLVADLVGRHPDALPALREAAELLAAPVVDRGGRFNLSNRHPLWRPDRTPLQEADCVLLLDVRDPYGALTETDLYTRATRSLMPPGCRIIEIGLGELGIRGWSQQFQRFQAVDLSILADTRLALPALVAACRERSAAGMLPPAASVKQREQRLAAWSAAQAERQQRWQSQARADWDARPMTPARLAAEVWAAIQPYDWVLTGSDLNGWTRRLWHFDRRERFAGKSLGTATQIGLGLGVALAYRGSSKLVVNIQPDGDLMFDAGALWIATHDRIPLLVVMYNNRAYYNDWEHQVQVARERGRDEANAYIGMEIDRPAPDFAALARAFGWYAEGPISDGNQVRAAVERAARVVLDEGRPALVDCVTRFR